MDATQTEVEFKGWPKIPRLNRPVIITEKIDGTNGAIVVTEDGRVLAQSRKRLITPQDDNFGFATWVESYKDELRLLGLGYHFGEWYGKGIQRNYGMNHRKFALFNVARWGDDLIGGTRSHPECDGLLTTVPVLAELSTLDTAGITRATDNLRYTGSYADGGNSFNNPEGVVVYHKASNTSFKITLKDDEVPKGVTS